MNSENVKINSKGTIISKAVLFDAIFGNFLFSLIAFVLWLAGIASIFAIVLEAFGFLKLENIVLASINILSAFFLFYLAVRFFYISKISIQNRLNLKKPKNL